MNEEIAVRAYVVPKLKNDQYTYYSRGSNIDLNRILVIDSETTVDSLQNLKFGHCKVYQNDELVLQCLFYDPQFLNIKEQQIIEEYAQSHDMRLYKVEQFVANIFLPEVYEGGTLCVGFNLPFDLSRLAIDFGHARGSMRGGFSFVLSNNKKIPRLQIRHHDSTKSFIRFGSSIDKRKRRSAFKGNFLDLRTLVHALTNERHSLASATELFNIDIKKRKVTQHGKVTDSYIDYNIQDVDATYALYKKAIKEYAIFGLDLPVTKVYSSASIGKACLKMMGIKSFAAKNTRIPNEMIGYIMTAYFGGRSEVKQRKVPVPITLLDFTSMYPTMCILMKLWEYIICSDYEMQECKDSVQQFIDSINMHDLQKKETWECLSVLVQLQPDNDVLPVRARYGNKNTWNIGINHVRYRGQLWYALPDVIASKLLTGKSPKIMRAVRFLPTGVQEGLEPADVLGRRIDPTRNNFFKVIIEHRKDIQGLQKRCRNNIRSAQLQSKQQGLKTIANATSYGIFMEVNTDSTPQAVIVNGLSSFEFHAAKSEQFGYFFNPLIAVFITSGARLILAIVEAILAKRDEVHAFCDTDSMAIPPHYKDEIQQFFQPLNPYSMPIDMFKVVDGDDGKPLENVLFYGISAKRYVIYRKQKQSIIIVKASSHGLKHLKNPLTGIDDRTWHEEVWRDIIKLHYGLATVEALDEKYGSAYSIAELDISTPTIMHRFERFNEAGPYHEKVKPFNFCIVGIGNLIDSDTHEAIKPLAPFRNNPQAAVHDYFVDYHTRRRLRGNHYWKRFNSVFWDYVRHPEAKFDGNRGILSRKYMKVNDIIHIGKESNSLDIAQIIGVEGDETIIYTGFVDLLEHNKDVILNTKPAEVRPFGILPRTWLYIQTKLADGKITHSKSKIMKKIIDFLSYKSNF